jgi:hypothetical protein
MRRFSRFLHADQIRTVAVDLVEPLVERSGRRRLDEDAASARQDEPNLPVTE